MIVATLSLHDILAPVGKDLLEVEEIVTKILQIPSNDWLEREVVPLARGGKLMRPALTLLSGQVAPAPARKRLLRELAAGLELLHIASLIHDDVIDRSNFRRNNPTINFRFGDELGILAGDYVYSRALLVLASQPVQTLREISYLMTTMCVGEVQQQLRCASPAAPDCAEEEYIEIAKRKTGVFASSCCGLGAGASGVRDRELICRLRRYGLYLGIAFQIRDDLDRHSPGILSGGSRAVPRGLLGIRELRRITWVSVILSMGIGLYFAFRSGALALVFLAAGVWSAISYSTPPLRLSYRPLLGELLAGMPATLSCVIGSFYVLTRTIVPDVIVAAFVHSFFSIGWLMQHHLPDIDADLGSSPPKVTTVAEVTRRFSRDKAPFVGATYFAVAGILSLAWGMARTGAFIPSFVLSTGAVICAVLTDPYDVSNITKRQIAMMTITGINSLMLGAVIGLSPSGALS